MFWRESGCSAWYVTLDVFKDVCMSAEHGEEDCKERKGEGDRIRAGIHEGTLSLLEGP